MNFSSLYSQVFLHVRHETTIRICKEVFQDIVSVRVLRNVERNLPLRRNHSSTTTQLVLTEQEISWRRSDTDNGNRKKKLTIIYSEDDDETEVHSLYSREQWCRSSLSELGKQAQLHICEARLAPTPEQLERVPQV